MIDVVTIVGMFALFRSLTKANKVDFLGFPKTLLKLFSSVMVILFLVFITLAAVLLTQNNDYFSYVIAGVAVFWVFFVLGLGPILDFIYGLIDPDRKFFKGEKLFINGKYQAAIRVLKPIAKRGNVDAQNIIGYIYLYADGDEIDQNIEKAIKWLKLSAAQGNARGQRELGVCFCKKGQQPKGYEEASKWFKLSAEQGNSLAQCDLGGLYLEGKGVQKDLYEAVQLFRLSAEQGYGRGQTHLGYLYLRGKGVKKDSLKAVQWFKRAAEQNDLHSGDAMSILGDIYYNGEKGVKQNYQEAIKWYQLAAERLNGHSALSLGWIYSNGLGVEVDHEKAVEWYRHGEILDHPDCMIKLALKYLQGEGVEMDEEEALRLLKAAGELGSELAVALADDIDKPMFPELYQKALEKQQKAKYKQNNLKIINNKPSKNNIIKFPWKKK